MIDTYQPRRDSGAMAVTRLINGHANGASEIEFKSRRFLITDQPTEATMDMFIEELNKRKVKEVVRVCDPTYDVIRLRQNGIHVVDWPMFEDGQNPPRKVLEEWLRLIKTSFAEHPDSCIAIHCVFGLGRAPVLVTIALMELGMKYEEAVELIRMKRRGALNHNQLEFLKQYKPRMRLESPKSRQPSQNNSCSIM